MKKSKEQKLLSSDAAIFKKYKLLELISFIIFLIFILVAIIMSSYYLYRPGDFGTETPRIVGFIFLGLSAIAFVAFCYFYFKVKNMQNKNVSN